jgi:uncharacterized protein (DUF849 family)
MSNIFEFAERDGAMRPGRRKVIISCGVTGATHTPSMSEFLPASCEAIAEQAIEAARAGAAVLRLHARDAEGRPTVEPEALRALSSLVAAETDAILNIDTSARAPLDERFAFPLSVKPELCSLEMGMTNLAFHRASFGVAQWRHAWEQAYVEGSEAAVVGNSFADIREVLTRLDRAGDVRFEYVCHDVGHLDNLAYFVDEGLARGPLFIQCVLGALGGLSAQPENLFVMRCAADRLFGRENYEFSVVGVGRNHMALAAMGAIMGGHVRVGLEDSLLLGRGLLASSCAAQVLKIRRTLEELSLDVATPGEAREILKTKGADKVNFDA